MGITRRRFLLDAAKLLGALWMSTYYHDPITAGDDVADYVINPRLEDLDQAIYNTVTGNNLFDNVAIGADAADSNVRLLIDALTASVAAVDIRGGGQTGRGFGSDPANAQGLMYLTHKISNPPAGLLGMVKGYMAYTGNLATSDATLEAFEIINRIQGATAAPAGYLLGAEIVAGLNNGGANMSALVFPNVTGILADVNAENANCGTITWARSLQTQFPSMPTTGNAITNAASAYIGASQFVTPSVTPTNSYGLYVEKPPAGTNIWAAMIRGNVEINDTTNGRLRLNPTAAAEFTVWARNQADNANAAMILRGSSLSVETGSTSTSARVNVTDTMTEITTRVRQGAPNSEPDAGIISAGQLSFWINESTHKLMVKVKYANGSTVKAGEVALT